MERTEDLAVVDADDRADHLGDDDHVAEVGLDDGGLLVGLALGLGLAELLHERKRLALEAALEATTGTRVDELGEGSRVEVEELRELWVVRARTEAGSESARVLLVRANTSGRRGLWLAEERRAGTHLDATVGELLERAGAAALGSSLVSVHIDL